MLHLFQVLNEMHTEEFQFLDSRFIDKLYGSDRLRLTIESGVRVEALIESWPADEKAFKDHRAPYLIY